MNTMPHFGNEEIRSPRRQFRGADTYARIAGDCWDEAPRKLRYASDSSPSTLATLSRWSGLTRLRRFALSRFLGIVVAQSIRSVTTLENSMIVSASFAFGMTFSQIIDFLVSLVFGDWYSQIPEFWKGFTCGVIALGSAFIFYRKIIKIWSNFREKINQGWNVLIKGFQNLETVANGSGVTSDLSCKTIELVPNKNEIHQTKDLKTDYSDRMAIIEETKKEAIRLYTQLDEGLKKYNFEISRYESLLLAESNETKVRYFENKIDYIKRHFIYDDIGYLRYSAKEVRNKIEEIVPDQNYKSIDIYDYPETDVDISIMISDLKRSVEYLDLVK